MIPLTSIHDSPTPRPEPRSARVIFPRVWIAVAAGLGVHLALVLGALATWPPPVRLLLAFVVMILLPGFAFVTLGARPPGGALFAPGWALGFGVAWNAVLVLFTRALGVPFTVLVPWSVPASALLWTLVLWRRPRTAVMPSRPVHPAAVVAILLAAALAAGVAARLGPPRSYASDTPDHVGTVRRMLASGDAFPNDAFFKDAGPLGADPRKGLWHAEAASITRLAALDPLDAWRGLCAPLIALLVLNIAAFGWLIEGSVGAAISAWAVVLTLGGSMASPPLRQAVFASRLADHLATATVVAVLADLDQRRRSTRLAAVGLAFATLAAHVYPVAQFALAFGALAIGMTIRDRGVSAPVRRLAGTAAAMALACAPYLVWRMHQAYAPHNIIHTQPQGLLWITDRLRVVSIGVLWDWVGIAWVLFPISAWWLWTRGRHRTPVLYVFTTAVALALVLFDPPVVAILQPRLGYLMMRMAWVLPLPALLAWAIPTLVRDIASAAGWSRRWRPIAGLAGLLLVLQPALSDAAHVLANPQLATEVDRRTDPLRWRDALAWMDRNLEPGRVVLSDPITSYSIPMMTRHYVVTLVDQHSSPNDSLALTRILDSRDALDPYMSWDRTRALMRHYGVDVIALNNRFLEIPLLDYWAPRPEWYAAARARFDRHPAAFERLYDTGDFVVYRVRGAALDSLLEPTRPRPFVSPWSPDRFPVGRRMGEGLPILLDFALRPQVAAPGDTLHGIVEWRAREPLPPGSYMVGVRFDRGLPAGFSPPAWIGKPVRKVIEHLHHERYRFRADHLPASGAYGIDEWRSDEVVRDSFELQVPTDVADGLYHVGVRMVRQPHYANLHVRDYLSDDDFFAGLPVGFFKVRRPGAPIEPTDPVPTGGH